MISISKESSMSIKIAIKIFFIMKKRVIKTITLFSGGRWWTRKFACFASRRIDSVWFSSTRKRIFYKIKKRVTEMITLSSGGRGWARAMLESSLATQAVALIVCGSHPPAKTFL